MDRIKDETRDMPPHAKGDGDEPSLEDVMREQEELAAVDTTISETIDVMRPGRDSVAQRFYRQEPVERSDDSAHPLDIIKTGRRRILDRIAHQNSLRHSATVQTAVGDSEAETIASEEEHIGELTRQLTEKLQTITNKIPQDRAQRQVAEAQIQAAVRSYLSGIHKVLHPIRFNRDARRSSNIY